MDAFIFSLTISCALASFLYVCKILNWVWFTPKSLETRLRRQGFAGNPYRLITGDLKEIGIIAKRAESKPINFDNDIVPRVYPIFHTAFQKYGEKCFVWFGPRPALIISEPEIVRDILLKNYIFQKIPGSPLARMLGRGLVMLEKDEWAKHRKLINPAFHVHKLKHMVGSFHLSCTNMLRKWEEIVRSDGPTELDVWPYLQAMTSDVISRAAFGSSYEEGGKIFRLQREQADCILRANRSLNIPGWRFLPTKENRRMKELAKEIESIFVSIISTRMESCNKEDDLLGILLESNSNEIKQHGAKCGMSMKEVIEECKIFFFAGQDTSASLLVWTLILLSKHHDWQARARDEVLQAFGRDKPDYQELTHLKIVSMIVYEVLRLYPPIVMLARLTDKECASGKVSVPAGVQLMLPVLLLHHDREIWGDDAKEFRPERFALGVSEATRGRLAFFPFGWGPRICIAQNFALLQAKMALATILQHYSFQLSPSYSHAPRTVVSLQPQHGAPLILTKI
ncbi:cytochrome P450 CYP72A219-like [Salvia miltiorrhiza]|uniref:cytochrome P450 CYP72A219-like n=1 Tax=Salvia miltiorrhiza TaxID=226208 RepID=UPI0025AD21D9|nr:cytochrome P450 CYP72A219-like [Salvia miltiorrhiza]